MNVKIEDIAKAAGVSTATVSRTLNNPEKVKGPTRDRIESVIKQMEYRPNYFARGLMKQKTDSVGILASFSMNSYLAEIMEAIELVLTKNGIYSYFCNCEFNIQLEKKYSKELFLRNIDALIVIEADSFNREDNYFIARQFDCPVILVNQHTNPFGGCYVVRVDQAPGINEVFDYVLAHELFPFLLFIGPGSYSFNLKEQLFNDWKKKHKLSDRDAGLYRCPGGIQTNTEEILWYTYHAMIKEILRSPSRPRFIFAGNDLMALGVLTAAKELQIPVPEELAVAGVDNTLFSRISSPPLSTVDLRMHDVGVLAAELYLQIKNSKENGIPRLKVLPSRFVLRSTTPF